MEDIRQTSNPIDAKYYTTERLRAEYHIPQVFVKDAIRMTYSCFDHIIIGGIMPVKLSLVIADTEDSDVQHILENREMGVINTGGSGRIVIDGTPYTLNEGDALYIGTGSKQIVFESIYSGNPSKFYFNTCLAHKFCPTTIIKQSQANIRQVSSGNTSAKRMVYQYLHPSVLETCQLRMGLTVVEGGNGDNWNPIITKLQNMHSKFYFYYNMEEDDIVLHMMGESHETRHLFIHNEEAAITPPWSIYAGTGTGNYSFIWSMLNESIEDSDKYDGKLIDLL